MKFSFYLPGKPKDTRGLFSLDPTTQRLGPVEGAPVPSAASIEVLCSEAQLAAGDYDLVRRIVGLCVTHAAGPVAAGEQATPAPIPSKRRGR